MNFSIEVVKIVMIIFLPEIICLFFKSRIIKGKYKKRKLVYIIELILKSVYMFIILFLAEDIELWNMDIKFYILGACIFIYYCLWIKFFVGGFSFRRKSRRPARDRFLIEFLPIVCFLTIALMIKSLSAFLIMMVYGMIHLINKVI